MKNEQSFEFRKRYSNPHKRIPQFKDQTLGKDEFILADGLKIYSSCEDIVANTAVRDFISYAKTAFGFKASTTDNKDSAQIKICIDTEKAEGYMARRIDISDKCIEIFAGDARGVAQALYSLEDRMNLRSAPFLKIGTTTERPMFTPRMTHSGYGMDIFSDGYISNCAHYGYDTLLCYVRSEKDYQVLDDLVKRAAPYGLDVYAYCDIVNFVHPFDEGAKEKYDKAYGDIFRNVPGLKGIVFVGESIWFPSKDPHVSPYLPDNRPPEAVFERKRNPGNYPCYDYKDWLTLARDSVRAVSPDADIVFWTYNWGDFNKERIDLLETIPTNVSLLATFETCELYSTGNSLTTVSDYTLSNIGPSTYFKCDAELAKRRGIKLYSMVNTAGRTWDYGVLPYLPSPGQWNERYKAILDCKEKYGLCGLMESHHYGFTPSFIAKLTQNAYTEGTCSYEELITKYAKLFSEEEYEKVLDAFGDLDESIKHIVPSPDNQYGPFRIGPAFPFCLERSILFPNKPGMFFGNAIYGARIGHGDDMFRSAYSMRVIDELAHQKKVLAYVKSALAKLKKIKKKNAELKKLVNMVDFMVHYNITVLGFKEFYITRSKLRAVSDYDSMIKYAKKLEKIALREIENVKATIPIVKRDSALGYEPSMEYQCNEECLEWKLKQMDYLLKYELKPYLTPVS